MKLRYTLTRNEDDEPEYNITVLNTPEVDAVVQLLRTFETPDSQWTYDALRVLLVQVANKIGVVETTIALAHAQLDMNPDVAPADVFKKAAGGHSEARNRAEIEVRAGAYRPLYDPSPRPKHH